MKKNKYKIGHDLCVELLPNMVLLYEGKLGCRKITRISYNSIKDKIKDAERVL